MTGVWRWLLVSALWGASSAARALPESELDSALAQSADLTLLERLALQSHPSLLLEHAQAEVEQRRVDELGGFAAPELVYQQWSVPLSRPYDLSRANMLMLGARVRIPHAAARGPERDAARERANAQHAAVRSTVRALRFEVRTAYLAYASVERSLALYALQAKRVARLEAFASARASFERMGATLAQALGITRIKLEAKTIDLEGERRSTVERLNLLAGRKFDAALGPPVLVPQARPDAGTLSAGLAEQPEQEALASGVREQERMLAAARVQKRRPEWMVGLDYMPMPEAGEYARYGAMVSMSMPWLSEVLRHAEARAQAELSQKRASVLLLQRENELALQQALAALDTAERGLRLVEQGWLPRAAQAIEASEARLADDPAALELLFAGISELFEAELMRIERQKQREAAILALQRLVGDADEAQTKKGRAP